MWKAASQVPTFSQSAQKDEGTQGATRFGPLTFANGGIAIEQLLLAVHKTWRQSTAHFESAGDGLHFLFTKLTSAHAVEYSVVLVHDLLL
jgi:hypothetical protein